MNHNRFLCCFIGAALGVACSAARASIIDASPTIDVLSPPPADVRTSQLESNTLIRAFAEQQDVLLNQAFQVNITQPGTYPQDPLTPGTIAAGTRVSSYYLHFDTIGDSDPAIGIAGFLTFSTDILGIITNEQRLDATDALPGLPTTMYAAADSGRGLEVSGDVGDILTFSADRRTVFVELHNAARSDDIRIITAAAVPEPSSWMLFAIGGAALAAWRRFRFGR